MSGSPTRGTYLSTSTALRTTDATATVVKSIPVYPGCSTHIKVTFLAREEGSESTMQGWIEAWFSDETAQCTQVGEQDTKTVKNDDGLGWTIALAASGNSAVLTATGAASTNIRWYAKFEVDEIVTPHS